MQKAQLKGVQQLTFESKSALVRIVNVVPYDRVMQIFAVNTDLMGAPGLQPELHIGIFPKALQYAKMRDGRFSILYDSHFLAVGRTAADLRGYDALVLLDASVDQCAVYAAAGLVCDLP